MKKKQQRRQYKIYQIDELPNLLTPGHIQSFLRIGRVQAYTLIQSGQFKFSQPDKLITVYKEDFLRWLLGK